MLKTRGYYIGDSTQAVIVNAGHVIASSTPPSDNIRLEDPNIYITAQNAAAFTATTATSATQPRAGLIRFTTLTGALTVEGPINADTGTVTLIGAAGINVNASIGDANTTGAITLTANAGDIVFNSDLTIGNWNVTLNQTGAAKLGPTTALTSATGTLTAGNGVEVGAGETLSGIGNVQANVALLAGGTISPGVNGIGTLTVASITGAANANLAMQLNSAAQTDQVIASSGPVNLAGLALQLGINFTPSVGDKFLLIRNDSGNPVQGQFASGATVAVGTFNFSVNYAGGDGNDVELTLTSITTNHAPVLDNAGKMALGTIDQGDQANSGTLVRDIIASAGGDRITDVDAGSLEGLAIVAADSASGIWQYTLDGTTWLPLGTVSGTGARLLAADDLTRVRFVPAFSFSGGLATALTFRAWDRSQETNGALVDVSTNGGTTPYSTATETASIFVRGIVPVATTTVFQNGVGGYTSEKDIQLRQNAADTATPTGSDSGGLLVDWPDNNNASHVLMRFDSIFGNGPGQIPLGSKILSATLEIFVGNPGDGGTFHRMLVGWNEAAATWNSMAGGIGADGVEALAGYNAAVGTIAIDDDIPNGFGDVNVTADLQAWANGDANNGWGIIAWPNGTNGWAFAPGENATIANRPKLTIEWEPPIVQSATFRQGVNGYTGAVDTALRQALPTTSAATLDQFLVDYTDGNDNEVHVLLRYDNILGTGAGQIPPGAIIQAAYLDFASIFSNSAGNGGAFYRMQNDWSDTDTWSSFGDGTGNHNAQPGVQADGTEARTQYFSSAGNPSLAPLVPSGFNSFSVTDDVQAWVDGEANHGWAILPWVGGSNAMILASSDYSLENLRPQLRVFYTMPIAEPPENVIDIASKQLVYTAGDNLANNVNVSVNGGVYTITDSSGPITLTSAAIAAGWTGSGTTTVTGPSSAVNSLEFTLGTASDTFTLMGTEDPITIDAGAGDSDALNFPAAITAPVDLTFKEFETFTAAGPIDVGTHVLSIEAAGGIGTQAQPLAVTAGKIIAQGGDGGVYINETDGASFTATATGNGAIQLAVLAGTLTVDGFTRSEAGDISLGSPGAVAVNAQIGDDHTAGRILIHANSDGVGNENYSQGTTGSLNTTSVAADAVSIEVNTAAGGAGNAVIGPGVLAGTYVVRARGGSVLWNPAFAIPAFNSNNTATLRANNYDFSTTSPTGSIGTLSSPIQTDNLSNASTATLNAGSGGIYLTDWGGADLNITQAIATGAGGIQLAAANATGHNITIAGQVTTGSGDITIYADDAMFINGSIGGAGYSGRICLEANRDAGNEQLLTFGPSSSVVTSNTSATALVVAIAAQSNTAGTAIGGIVLDGTLQVGNGGTITLDAAFGTAADRSGAILRNGGTIDAGGDGDGDFEDAIPLYRAGWISDCRECRECDRQRGAAA